MHMGGLFTILSFNGSGPHYPYMLGVHYNKLLIWQEMVNNSKYGG